MSITKDMVEQLLDPNAWTETQYLSSTDSVCCPHPHCGARFNPAALGNPPALGLYYCAACKRPFIVRIDENTPLGKAWRTEATSEAKLNAAAAAKAKAANCETAKKIQELIHDLQCNHAALGRDESIYSRAIEMIEGLTKEPKR